jgi:hypothetical protein
MKKNVFDNIKTILIIILTTLTCLIESLPWWSFVIPVVILGIIITFRTWDVLIFPIGFLSGFITWFGANLYFDMTSNAIVLNKMALLLTVNKIVVLLISGLIGGLLTGLALYTGKSIIAYDKISDLDEKLE